MNTSTLGRKVSAAIGGGCAIACVVALGGGPVWAAAPVAEDTMTVIDSRAERSKMTGIRAAPRYAETRSVVVRYGDLDLARDAGVQTLYARLIRASQAVCAPREDRIPAQRADWRRCHDAALDEAVVATGLERIVALHRERSGRDLSTPAELLAATAR
ncbi:MAG: hypothetical protein CALGDGBN_00451 [Pseudomonadales bacterium]|nr:hypothetical protein [Pseudomonadales bacterium]